MEYLLFFVRVQYVRSMPAYKKSRDVFSVPFCYLILKFLSMILFSFKWILKRTANIRLSHSSIFWFFCRTLLLLLLPCHTLSCLSQTDFLFLLSFDTWLCVGQCIYEYNELTGGIQHILPLILMSWNIWSFVLLLLLLFSSFLLMSFASRAFVSILYYTIHSLFSCIYFISHILVPFCSSSLSFWLIEAAISIRPISCLHSKNISFEMQKMWKPFAWVVCRTSTSCDHREIIWKKWFC